MYSSYWHVNLNKYLQFKGYIPLSSTNALPLGAATINVRNYVIIKEIY